MKENLKVVAIIPARGGSQRLKRKNIYPIFEKPMLAWSIEACQRSEYIDAVYVSTEDQEIANIALEYGANVIPRTESLADHDTPKMEVIRHADQWLQQEQGSGAEVLISVQANSPELKHSDIDKGIEMLVNDNLFEVISVGKDMIQNASFRVIRQTCLYNTFLSAHLGVVINECVDVHTIEDVLEIEQRHQSKQQLTNFVTT